MQKCPRQQCQGVNFGKPSCEHTQPCALSLGMEKLRAAVGGGGAGQKVCLWEGEKALYKGV